jgi:hypothetical protein
MAAGESDINYRIMKAARQSPMRLNDVADESSVDYLLHENAQFATKPSQDS